MDEIDAWLYINLEKSIDRRERIEKELQKITTKFYRIEAIENNHNTTLGCLKSQVKAVEFAKQQNFNTVVILEDDFLFENIETLGKDLDDIFEEEFDGAELWISHVGKPYVKHKSKNIYKCFNTVGKFGYILKSHIYDRVIESFLLGEKNGKACDIALWPLQRSLEWITKYPYIGKHVEGYSTILKRHRFTVEGHNPT
jgi:GR25 family glycosyltransferase involved in LPS biosynthesis